MAYANGYSSVYMEEFALHFTNAAQQRPFKFAGKTAITTGVRGHIHHESFTAPYDLEDRGEYGSDVKRIVVQTEDVQVTLLDKAVRVSADIFEQVQVQPNILMKEAEKAAYALNRMQDQIILNSLVGSSPESTVTAGSNMNVASLRETKKIMDNANISEDDRFIVATPNQADSLLAEQEVTSSDYNTVKALVDGQVNSFLGFNFIWFGTGMSTGGLPASASVRKCYAYTKDMLLSAYAIQPTVIKYRDNDALSDVILPHMRMGAKLLQDNGAVLINCTEA